MLIVVAVFLGVLSFRCPSHKIVTVLDLVFLWALFAFNTSNADYGSYAGIYSVIGSGNFYGTTVNEEGYIFLAYFCNHVLHFTYAQFIVLIATLSTALLTVILKLYLNWQYQNIVLILFMVLNYWIMICQYRTYIGVLLSLIGIYFLIRDDAGRGILLFAVFILLGGLFHRACLIFLLFIFVKCRKLSYIVALVPVMIGGVLLLRTNAVYRFLNLFISDYKLRWLTGDSTRSWFGVLVLIAVRLILLFLEYRTCRNDSLAAQEQDAELRLEGSIVKISTISLSFIALEFFYPDFERLFRLPLFLSLIFFAVHLKHTKVSARKMPITVLFFWGFFVLYMLYFYIGFRGWFSSVFVPVFTENSLLTIFG